MLLFRFSCFQIILLAFLAVPVSQASAQREDIGDQPGLIPNAADEELPLQFRRQTVFYRSTEAPGTIIVHTAERFLYVVQPNGRAIRYGIGVGREGFQWRAMRRFDNRCLPALCAAAQAFEAERSCHFTGCHFEGTACTGGAPQG